MNNVGEYQRNTMMHYWGPKVIAAALLMLVGYKTPTIWFVVSATIWAGYAASRVMSPLLVAASQSTRCAKIAKGTLSVLGDLAAAALFSAPIAVLHWYRII